MEKGRRKKNIKALKKKKAIGIKFLSLKIRLASACCLVLAYAALDSVVEEVSVASEASVVSLASSTTGSV